MSGVFGLINRKEPLGINQVVPKMGQKMTHRPWYQVDTFCDVTAGIGFGRVGIGIFNAVTQPVACEDNEILLFLAGEFYDTAQIRNELEKKGHSFRDSSNAELALRLYQEFGPDFPNTVEGVFIVAIWDRSRGQLLVANDRFGFKPLYYSRYGHKFIFAPEIKGILAEPSFTKKLNLTAVAEYMRFQQLLGEKSFFENIFLLSPATVFTIELETLRVSQRCYWNWRTLQLLTERVDEREIAEETERLLRQAVSIRLERADRPGILLTGGLDSRCLLAVLDPKYQPITTITYGQSACRDVYLAGKIARLVGTKHHFFEFEDGNWVKEIVDFHLITFEMMLRRYFDESP